jgi:hypothetical protein
LDALFLSILCRFFPKANCSPTQTIEQNRGTNNRASVSVGKKRQAVHTDTVGIGRLKNEAMRYGEGRWSGFAVAHSILARNRKNTVPSNTVPIGY